MKIPRNELATAIGERTLHERDFDRLAHEVAAYLLSEKRDYELESLIRDILAYRLERGIVEAELISAHDVSADITHEVKLLLKQHYPGAKQVVTREIHDNEVIGGINVKLAHEQLDMSIRAKLDTFKRLTNEGIL